MAQFDITSDNPLAGKSNIVTSYANAFVNGMRGAGATDDEIRQMLADPEITREFQIALDRDAFAGLPLSRGLFDKWRSGAKARAEKAQQDKNLAEQDRQRGALTSRIEEFVNMLQQAPGMNDPVYAGLVNAGRAEAGRWMGQSGVRGGLADLASAEAAQRTALPYLANRQNLAASGLGLLNQREMGLGQLDQNWAQLNLQAQQMNNQNAMAEFAQQKNNAQATGSTIGGALGLGAGLVATAATGGAAAPLIAPLTAGGSALGGGIGGMTSPGYNPRPYTLNRSRSAFSGY